MYDTYKKKKKNFIYDKKNNLSRQKLLKIKSYYFLDIVKINILF